MQQPDRDIERLLEKYKASDWQWTMGRGPSGHRAVMLRFRLKEKTYRFNIETLDADADERMLVLQSKRAIFWMLKAVIEASTVFFTPEQAMFAFLELPDGVTTYEVASPKLSSMTSREFLTHIHPRELPAPAR